MAPSWSSSRDKNALLTEPYLFLNFSFMIYSIFYILSTVSFFPFSSPFSSSARIVSSYSSAESILPNLSSTSAWHVCGKNYFWNVWKFKPSRLFELTWTFISLSACTLTPSYAPNKFETRTNSSISCSPILYAPLRILKSYIALLHARALMNSYFVITPRPVISIEEYAVSQCLYIFLNYHRRRCFINCSKWRLQRGKDT